MRPALLLLVAAAAAAVLTASGRPAASADEADVSFEADVLYAKAGGEDLQLDVAWPAKAKAPVPGIVVFHGGGWTMGNRKSEDDFCRTLAAAGYAAATATYRFAPKHPWPAQIEDAKAAVRFLRREGAKWKIDPDRIGAVGFSSGAHLSLMLGTTGPADKLEGKAAADAPSSAVQAVVSWYAPTDLTADDFNQAAKGFIAGLFSHGGDSPKARRAASPVSYVDSADAPMLLLHGTKDEGVPMSQAIKMADAMTAAGARGDVRLLVGAPHAWLGEYYTQATAETLRWFDRHLLRESKAR